jgi:hypothetical protein
MIGYRSEKPRGQRGFSEYAMNIKRMSQSIAYFLIRNNAKGEFGYVR